eukprot:TRINITY_DN17486_c0_g1_i1.p1 TRINITY_DN17486_c0_g1~~TRINITY_DN17486_c0_g1_i1.p1  ORF type:complete len:177 (+),score=17.23 TRINITY_DN17486_c0_g1_i1:182-712(+)
MAAFRNLAVLCVVLLAAASLADARVPKPEFLKAIKAIRSSRKVAATTAPLVEKLFRMVMQVDSSTGNVTLLVPADLAALAGGATLPQMSPAQFDKVKRYHLLDGGFLQADIKALPRGGTLPTLEGQSIKKISGDVIPVVMLKGRDVLPSILIAGDVYVGETLTVHVISSTLYPSDY